MAEPPVVDASPLIVLSRIGAFDLLRVMADVLFVPVAVEREIAMYGGADVTARAVAEAEWLTIVQTPAVPVEITSWNLGEGESAALTWALAHAGTEVITDDGGARRCAAALNIPARGTLGVVLLARQSGIIPYARPVIGRLQQAGLYLSDQIVGEALRLVGE